MGADQGMPERAPKALAAAPNPMIIEPGIYWYRIARMGPLFFSSAQDVRFSCAEIPHGVLYLGRNPETCFWEVFWELLQSTQSDLRLPKERLKERKIHRARIKRPIRVFDAEDPVQLKAIGANGVGCFNGPYNIARSWATLLYASDPKLDGIRFPSARAGGGINLALFGGRVEAKDIVFEKNGVPLTDDPEITKLILDSNISLIE